MSQSHHFLPASAFTLEAFADLYTRSFAGYFYPMAQTVAGFSARVRIDQLDLHHSVVLLVNDVPAGQATLGLRGTQAWCGGFGIAPEFRGRGLGPPLFAQFIARARKAGATHLALEALTRNAAALKVYTGAGLRIAREMRLFEWIGDVPDPKPMDWPTADPVQIAQHFQRLHAVAPVWGRDLPSLLLRPGLREITMNAHGHRAGNVLFSVNENTARIVDVGAESADVATALLMQLQASFAKVVSIDEPADSPLTAAFDRCGFRQFDQQYELKRAL